jgi:hypothetical protein
MCAQHRLKQGKLPDGDSKDFCPTHDKRAKEPHIFCPRCHMPSWNPNDIANRFCGSCHQYHADMTPEAKSET